MKSEKIKFKWDEVVDEVKTDEVVLLGFFIICNIMMKSIDHRRSDQGEMDGHYHHEQAR